MTEITTCSFLFVCAPGLVFPCVYDCFRVLTDRAQVRVGVLFVELEPRMEWAGLTQNPNPKKISWTEWVVFVTTKKARAKRYCIMHLCLCMSSLI